MAFADSRAVKVPRVWDLLSQADRPVVVLGVPQTYPVSSVNGVMVSCFLTPDTESSQYTYPAELKGEIDDLVGRYMVDVDNFRTEEKERLLEQIEEMTARRFRVAEHLLETRPWDLFFMVEMGTDRIHHAFWRFFDHEHRLYEPGNPYEQAVLDYYKALDEKMGRLLRFADEDTTVLVVSDHGAKKMDGGICVNEWLRREGYLVLRDEPAEPGPLKPEMIDWERTTAWGEGGYYCRLFLNVAGREPQGLVPPQDYERVRSELKQKLEALGDPTATRSARSPTAPKTSTRSATASSPTSSSTSATSRGEASGSSAEAPCTCSRTTRAPTTRTMRTTVSTSSRATGSRPGKAHSKRSRTLLRRFCGCSASRCRRRWKARSSRPRPRSQLRRLGVEQRVAVVQERRPVDQRRDVERRELALLGDVEVDVFR